MKQSMPALTWKVLAALAAIPLFAGQIMAQGSRGPLSVEGLNQQMNHSAASRSFGGVAIGTEGGIGLMFLNPASLQSLGGVQVSVGGLLQSRDLRQEQHFAPVRYYPNLSLLLEGLTDRIPNPDPDLVGFTPADSVQRPYDDIQPRWSRSETRNVPLHALLAAPISLGGLTITAGIGAVQYANLNHYYQNNNVLEPDILSQRPLPILRPTDDDPVSAEWYQSIRSREGSIYGYGMSLAGYIERYNLTVGVSGMLLDGESDDFEERVNRGTLVFYANEFRADSSIGRATKIGTSEFSGSEFTVGSTWNGRFASVGFVLKPPTTYTRTYRTEFEADTAGAPIASALNAEDEFRLPWRGSVGLMLKPRDNLNIGLEYEFRPYSSATFSSAQGEETTPWHSSSLFRIGTEYRASSWLVLRGGIRGEADVFIPAGSAIENEPATYTVFSAGFGLEFSGVRWNVAYENAEMKYEDIWASALNKNRDRRHTVITEISLTIPTGR